METKYEELIDKLQRAYERHKNRWERMVNQKNLSISEIINIREERAKIGLLETILNEEGRMK